MDDDAAAELARLRERAYGRTADIAGDAPAMRRLRELEARLVPAAAPPIEEPQPDPAPDADVVPGVPVARAPRWRRWVMGAAVLVGAAALVAGTVAVTLSIPRDVPRYPDAMRVATLDTLEPWPPQSDSASRRHEDFRGFSVFTNTVGTSADPNPVRCLSVVSPDEAADPTVGETFSACGAGPFPVSVTTVVSSLSPQAAQDAYAPGTAINFTLGEDGVEVWVIDR
ncbi:hypothetical protein [Microbacterium oleivorans]|uniref:ABC-type spermidine/putrescine transport system, permease component II n=1 Tax=Microbacterium oleivorans TaxID=273677 RepID=A0A031FWA6_9MICO|nr:hypothetical protein [Microbacterium oleivorans]EZP29124.1 ABC-type spermidine/putrescine transport system, permease component II [Microbacterium oleivorans]